MIKIGTNFSYKGILFLDDRQGIARSKSDLKSWSIPVPEGFEVYLPLDIDPAWYTYKSSYNSDETGHFERRLDKAYVDNQISLIQDEIDNIWHGSKDGLGGIEALWAAIGNYTLPTQIVWSANFGPSGNNGFTWLPSNSITPTVHWSLGNKDILGQTTLIPYSEIESVTMNGSSIPVNNGNWTAPSSISTTTTYTLKVTYNGTQHTKQQTYTFKSYDWIKYAGVSSQATLISLDDLDSPYTTKQGWGNGSKAYEKDFNCSAAGGRYPYYIFLKTLDPNQNLKMKVWGYNTDYVRGSLTIGDKDYWTIRTGNIMTHPQVSITYE